MAGTSVSSVSALAMNRVRHTSQYGACLSSETTAASANEDTKGAISTAPPMNTATRRKVSKRVGASLNRRTQTAATTASLQLVAKSASTSKGGNGAPNLEAT
jgi:hypothetical protein